MPLGLTETVEILDISLKWPRDDVGRFIIGNKAKEMSAAFQFTAYQIIDCLTGNAYKACPQLIHLGKEGFLRRWWELGRYAFPESWAAMAAEY